MADWFRRHRKGLLIALVIVLVLAAAYFLTEKPNTPTREETASTPITESRSSEPSSKVPSAVGSDASSSSREDISSAEVSILSSTNEKPQPESSLSNGETAVPSKPESSDGSVIETTSIPEPTPELPTESSSQLSTSPAAGSSPQPSTPPITESSAKPAPEPSRTVSSQPSTIISSPSSTAASQAESTIPPHESREESHNENSQHRCTISISCSVLLDNMEQLRKNKRQLVPSDGVILSACEVTFEEGESVFDVTKRLCREKGIPFEFTLAPVYHTAYIEGIYNLYEFDCGSGSGWVYAVNDQLPSVGCSDCPLQSGDTIEWMYTCTLGHDVEDILKERAS